MNNTEKKEAVYIGRNRVSSAESKTKFRKIVSVASGKGGVGKTLTTVNLAIAARRMGYSVLILDGDLGLANVDVVLGLKARYNINDIFEDRAGLKDIILDGPLGVKIIPSGSGIARLTQLTLVQRLQLLEQIELLNESYDLLLIDTGAGISENVLHLNSVADEVLVVTTPEPHAMTDAYAFIKVFVERYGKRKLKLISNMTRSETEGDWVSKRIADVSKRFLDIELGSLGVVPFDPQVQTAIMLRQAATDKSTYTIAGQAWNKIARSLFDSLKYERHEHVKRNVWYELMSSKSNPAISQAIL